MNGGRINRVLLYFTCLFLNLVDNIRSYTSREHKKMSNQYKRKNLIEIMNSRRSNNCAENC